MTQSKHQHRTLLIVALIWIFPPAAWYLMWKDKTYHSWFAYLTWIFGGATLLIVFLQSAIVIPKMMNLYSDFSVSVPNPWPTVIISGAFGLAQIIFGIYLYQQVKKSSQIQGWQMLVFCLTQLVYFIGLPAYFIYSIINPIYSLSSQL